MTMELLDSEPPSPENEDQSAWFSYVDKYVKPDGNEVGDGRNKLRPNPLFLKRNRRKPATVDDVKKEIDLTDVAAATATSSEEQESATVVRYVKYNCKK